MVRIDYFPTVNDKLGILTDKQKHCYNELLEIKYHKEHKRIYRGITVKIDELSDGVYSIQYNFNWEKSGNEIFA